MKDLIAPLQPKNSSYRKQIVTLEKGYFKDRKKLKESIKKKKDEISKLRKKTRKDSSLVVSSLLDQSTRQLYSQHKELASKEEDVTRRFRSLRKSHFHFILAGFKPIIEKELKIFEEKQPISMVLRNIEEILKDEQIKQEYIIPSTDESFKKEMEKVIPDSPSVFHRGSVMGSRAGSLLSLTSFTDTSSFANKENIIKTGNDMNLSHSSNSRPASSTQVLLLGYIEF